MKSPSSLLLSTVCLGSVLLSSAAYANSKNSQNAPHGKPRLLRGMQPTQKHIKDNMNLRRTSTEGNDEEEFPDLPRIDETRYVEMVVMMKSGETPGCGTIRVTLDGGAAPYTVGNFLDLVSKGVYDGLAFHRHVEGFVVQGGDPQSLDPAFPIDNLGTGGYVDPETGKERTLPLEIKAADDTKDIFYNEIVAEPVQLSHDLGVIGMARSSTLDSASSQFYFSLADISMPLDGRYAVFGKVTKGLDIVQAIRLGDQILIAAEVSSTGSLAFPEECSKTGGDSSALYVRLVSFDPSKKSQVVEEVRAITGGVLKDALELVTNAPSIIPKDMSKEAAQEATTNLEALGAAVEIVAPVYHLRLTSVDPSKKTEVVQEVGAITGKPLVEALDLVTNTPSIIILHKDSMSKEAAQEAKTNLEALGAVVEVVETYKEVEDEEEEEEEEEEKPEE